ncbi:DUF58 domain-containing protein [Candidatus Sumerlaeota bacterium]|nr:DUF58 domain-containing protein [Candidatus Sumerlaeota bacterium]
METQFTFLSKRNVLVFFSFFSLYMGYSLGNRLLICFGFALLGLVIMTGHSAHNFFRDFSAQRIHYKRTFENEELRVKLRLTPGVSIPLYMLEIEDSFPAGDVFSVKCLIPYRIDSRSTLELEYATICARKRGAYVLGPLKLVCSDPFGIHKRKVELPVLTDLLLYPQAPELTFFEVLGEGTLSQVGIETLLRPGRSEEFIGLREYRKGDSPRRIHWRSSAHHQELLVKEFKEDIVTEVSLFLDMRRLALSGIGDVTSVEYIIKAAAAIAKISIEKCHLVQAFILAEEMKHIPAGGGYQQLITLLDRFTFLRPKGEGMLEDDIASRLPLLKSGSTVILIVSSTNVHPETLLPLLRQMVDKNIRISIILVDDRTFIKIYKDQEVQHKKALPLFILEDILLRESCSLYFLSKGDDIAGRLQER